MAAAKFTVEYPDIPVLITRLKKVSKEMAKQTIETLQEEGDRTVNEQMILTPFDTGQLSANNAAYTIRMPGNITMTLLNSTPYARYVEFGTGSSGAEAPAEFFPAELEWRYGAVTGYRARPFFYPPAIAANSRITSRFNDISKKEIEYAADVKQIGTITST